MTAATAFISAHDVLASISPPSPKLSPSLPPQSKNDALILELHLLTAVPLKSMREFYHDKIGLKILEESQDFIRFAAGATNITFAKARPEHGEPFYHFAFNISQNKIKAARDWQAERSALVPTPEHLLDPAFPNDVRHFRNWNAHSVFFFDPAYNIVEYIARHDLKNDADGGFTSADILYASEIGFVVEDHHKAARMLNQRLGLESYPRGTGEWWWAMGDERGLLLCLNKGRVFGENTATPKTFAVFPTEAIVRTRFNDKAGPIEFDGLPYRVRTR